MVAELLPVIRTRVRLLTLMKQMKPTEDNEAADADTPSHEQQPGPSHSQQPDNDDRDEELACR